MGVRERERLWVQGGPGRGGEAGVMETLAVDELVSMEWRELQEEDSESLFCWESEECVGVRPSLSEGLLESLEETLTESMLSPELPVGGERGVSLTGELAELLSVPRNSRLSLFTMLFLGLGKVGLLSPRPSIAQDKE